MFKFIYFFIFIFFSCGITLYNPFQESTFYNYKNLEKKILFSENFENFNFFSWNIALGSWVITTDLNNNKLLRQYDYSLSCVYYLDNAWNNYNYSCQTKITSFQSAANQYIGIIFRVQDENNYYFFRISSFNNIIEIGKKVSGSDIIMDSISYTINDNDFYNLKISCYNNSLSGFINQSLILSVSDSQFASGSIGFIMDNSYGVYDNLIIY